MSDLHTISLALDDIHQLFEEPAFDPFREKTMYTSGIEHVYRELKPLPLRKVTQFTIFLPPEQIAPTLQQEVKRAVERYCLFRVRQNKIEISALRWKGIKALQSGLVVLAVCVLLAAIIENVPFLGEFWQQFLGEGLIIIGWVSLWTPTEILLYEWWPYWRENQLLRHMAAMEVVIQPNQPAA